MAMSSELIRLLDNTNLKGKYEGVSIAAGVYHVLVIGLVTIKLEDVQFKDFELKYFWRQGDGLMLEIHRGY